MLDELPDWWGVAPSKSLRALRVEALGGQAAARQGLLYRIITIPMLAHGAIVTLKASRRYR